VKTAHDQAGYTPPKTQYPPTPERPPVFVPSFDPCYVQGYTAALQDVVETFKNIQTDLKDHKRKQNAKTYLAILSCMLENRTILRETTDSFIRCNDNAASGFELWRECWNKGRRKI